MGLVVNDLIFFFNTNRQFIKTLHDVTPLIRVNGLDPCKETSSNIKSDLS